MSRRTHSTIDKLPEGIRRQMTAMIVDGDWPDGMAGDGKPTYDDVTEWVILQGYSVSRSAVGRWAKEILTFERMRDKASIVRTVMSDVTGERASETQRAAAELLTARALDLALTEDMDAKALKHACQAIRDCAAVIVRTDQYIREQARVKAEKADQKITEIAGKKKIDPETLRMIREQVYGIVS